MTAAVSVVVLSWNDGELLDHALSSIPGSRRSVELIVVDNGSAPPVEVSGVDIRLVRLEENRGVAAGRNVGVRASTAPVVCFLDSDAVLLPGSLDRLVDVLDERPDVALVAPTFVDQTPEASAGAAPGLVRKVERALGRTESYAPGRQVDAAGTREVDFAIGACQVFRRVAYDDVGGLDESYFYGPEDADFCMRIRLAGWHVLQVSDALVVHPPRRRNRRVFTRRGLRHAWAVARFLARHRGFQRKVARAGA